MNVWMYAIREMEDAIDDCEADCLNCNDDPVHAWDEFVAFYSGSLEGTDGSGTGTLLYNLADKRCENFKTCGSKRNKDSGTSYVNTEIMSLAADGRDYLLASDCTSAIPVKNDIVTQMQVPLIQGTLRCNLPTSHPPLHCPIAYLVEAEALTFSPFFLHTTSVFRTPLSHLTPGNTAWSYLPGRLLLDAYKMDYLSGGDEEKAEGLVFARAILPMVSYCDADDADTIYHNMVNLSTADADVSYKAVRKAFENNYDCLDLSCKDIGGLLKDNGDYYSHAHPCKDSSGSDRGLVTWALITICVLAALFVAVGAVAGYFAYLQKKSAADYEALRQKYEGSSTPLNATGVELGKNGV